MTMVQSTLWMPERQTITMPLALTSITALTATGHKYAFVGRVWNKDRAAKNITKLGFRFGAITKSGGSGLTVSLQHVDVATNGPPFQPDGTQLQTVAIANGNTNFATGTWIETAALGSVQAVNHGDLLCVVIEYDGSGHLGSDSVVITSISDGNINFNLDSGAMLYISSWAPNTVASNNGVILEFDDGTFGTLSVGYPATAASSDAFNNGSNPEIIGLEFQVPFACKCDGAWLGMQAAAGASFDVQLYDGNTLMTSSSVSAKNQRAAATAYYYETIFAEQILVANHTYRIGLRPTTTNNVTLYNFSVSNANHLQAWPGGTSWMYNTFHTSAWGTPTATKRPLIGLRLSAVDDGTGSGGGGTVSGARMIGG